RKDPPKLVRGAPPRGVSGDRAGQALLRDDARRRDRLLPDHGPTREPAHRHRTEPRACGPDRLARHRVSARRRRRSLHRAVQVGRAGEDRAAGLHHRGQHRRPGERPGRRSRAPRLQGAEPDVPHPLTRRDAEIGSAPGGPAMDARDEALLQIGIAAALADGVCDERERSHLDALARAAGVQSNAAFGNNASLPTDPGTRLDTPEVRLAAYDLAVAVCNADGICNEPETRFLATLRATLGLSETSAAEAARTGAALAGSSVSGAPVGDAPAST